LSPITFPHVKHFTGIIIIWWCYLFSFLFLILIDILYFKRFWVNFYYLKKTLYTYIFSSSSRSGSVWNILEKRARSVESIFLSRTDIDVPVRFGTILWTPARAPVISGDFGDIFS
jgi:hypothetical protein